MWQLARVLHISGRGRFALICLRKWMKWAPPPPTHTRENFSFLLYEEIWEFLMMMMSYMVRCFNDPRLWGTCERERERHSPRERLQQRSLAVTATRQGAHGHHHSTGKKKKKKRKREINCSANLTVKVASHLHKLNAKKQKRNERKKLHFFSLLLESTCCIFFFSLVFCLLLISSRW